MNRSGEEILSSPAKYERGYFDMKKLLSALLVLTLCLGALTAALAEETPSVEYTTAEYEAPFFYSKKEKAFDPYKKNANEQQGTIEALEYDCPAYAFNAILGANETIHKKLYVYLPYGYDAAQQYNVLYLMHGGGDNQEYWLGKDKELTGGRPVFGETTQNVLDNMIAEGLCEPLIVVGPTFYSEVEGLEISEEQVKAFAEEIDEPNYTRVEDLYTWFFRDEIRNDIIPLIESRYSTYAGGDVSEESLIASREHRAYAGLSMGSITSAHSILMANTDIIAWVGSWSGLKTNFELFKATMEEKFADYPIRLWYNGEGVEDIAFVEHMQFHNDVTSKMTDTFVDGENYAMVVLEDGNHAWTSWITHLYNVLLVFFK